jgi:hypothetical protein
LSFSNALAVKRPAKNTFSICVGQKVLNVLAVDARNTTTSLHAGIINVEVVIIKCKLSF